jgi:hypothetical protein
MNKKPVNLAEIKSSSRTAGCCSQKKRQVRFTSLDVYASRSRQQLRLGDAAHVHQRFIAPEKVKYVHLLGLAGIHILQRRKELIHRKRSTCRPGGLGALSKTRSALLKQLPLIRCSETATSGDLEECSRDNPDVPRRGLLL